jgi:hypothetical protein
MAGIIRLMIGSIGRDAGGIISGVVMEIETGERRSERTRWRVVTTVIRCVFVAIVPVGVVVLALIVGGGELSYFPYAMGVQHPRRAGGDFKNTSLSAYVTDGEFEIVLHRTAYPYEWAGLTREGGGRSMIWFESRDREVPRTGYLASRYIRATTSWEKAGIFLTAMPEDRGSAMVGGTVVFAAPWWFLAVLFVWAPIALWRRVRVWFRIRKWRRTGCCTVCGYALAPGGLTRCPECGCKPANYDPPQWKYILFGYLPQSHCRE